MLNKAIADIDANKAEANAKIDSITAELTAAHKKDIAELNARHDTELEALRDVQAADRASLDAGLTAVATSVSSLAAKEANDVLALNNQLASLASSLDTQKAKQAADIATERNARTAGDASVASSLTTTINNAINQVQASLSSAVSSLSGRAASLEAFRTKVSAKTDTANCYTCNCAPGRRQLCLKLVDCLSPFPLPAGICRSRCSLLAAWGCEDQFLLTIVRAPGRQQVVGTNCGTDAYVYDFNTDGSVRCRSDRYTKGSCSSDQVTATTAP